MTDRDLLEKAARAAGYELDSTAPYEMCTCGEMREWNPLEDDGDALRLAVKLGIVFETYEGATWAYSIDDSLEGTIREISCGDQLKTVRRAIVRAAAAIGEKK